MGEIPKTQAGLHSVPRREKHAAENVVNQDPNAMLMEIETIKEDNRSLRNQVQELRNIGIERKKMLQDAEEFLKVQEAQMQELHRQFSFTVNEVSKYEAELRTKDEVIAGQFEDISKLKESVRNPNRASESKIQEQNEIIFAMQDEIEILRQEKVQRRKEIGKLEHGRSEMEEKIGELEKTLQDREKELENHEKELRSYKEMFRQSILTLEQREKEFLNHNKTLRDHTEQLCAYEETSQQSTIMLEQREEELRMQKEELRACQERSHQQEMAYQQELEQSARRLSHTVQLHDEITSINEKLEEDREQAVNEKAIISGAIQEIHNELAAKEKELSTSRHDGAQQQKRVSTLKSELAKASAARDSLEHKIEDILKKQVIAETELVVSKNAQIEELNTKLSNKELDVSNLKRQLASAEQRVEQASQRSQGAHEEHHNEIKIALSKRDEQLQLLEDYLLERKAEEQQLSEKLQKMEKRSEESAHLSLAERAAAHSEINRLAEELRQFQNSQKVFDEEMRSQQRASQILEEQLIWKDQELSRRRVETAEFRMILSQKTKEMTGWKQMENERAEANGLESRAIIEEMRAEVAAEKEDNARISALLEEQLHAQLQLQQQQEPELHKEREPNVVTVQKTYAEIINQDPQDELQIQDVACEPRKMQSVTTLSEPWEDTHTTLPARNFEITSRDDDSQALKRVAPRTTRPGKTATSARGSIRSSLQASYSKLASRMGAGLSAPSAAHPTSTITRMLINPPKDAPPVKLVPVAHVPHESPDRHLAAPQRSARHTSDGGEPVAHVPQFFSSSYASQYSSTLHLDRRPDKRTRPASPPVFRRDMTLRSPNVEAKREILRKGMGTGGYPRRGNLSSRGPSENGRDSWIFAG